MGYYTTFKLDITHPNGDEVYSYVRDIVKEDLHDISGGYLFYAGTKANVIYTDDIKWYNHTEDMMKMSKRYVKLVFHLIGNGEESGDFWHALFYHGKYVIKKAELVPISIEEVNNS